jgi:hypothetical protein
MRVDQAAKKRRICQHRNSAVASKAFTNEAPGRIRGANLSKKKVHIKRRKKSKIITGLVLEIPDDQRSLPSGMNDNEQGSASRREKAHILTERGEAASTVGYWMVIL